MEQPGHVASEPSVRYTVYKGVDDHVDTFSVDLEQGEPGGYVGSGRFEDDQDEDGKVGDEEGKTDQVDG